MLISNLNNKHMHHKHYPTFGSGKTLLFTDFDGTLLPEPIKPIYSENNPNKEKIVSDFNKYFEDFKKILSSAKDNFSIFVTTGRRISDSCKYGFCETYNKMYLSGIKLPKIKAVITTEGGDIYPIMPSGQISQSCDGEKLNKIEQLSGWSHKKVKSIIDNVLKVNGLTTKNSDRGNFWIETAAIKGEHVEKVKSAIIKELKTHGISARVYANNGRKIKLKPVVHGHSLSKDFDVKLALKHAVINDDLVIAAGNDTNDLKMLNIFRYVELPKDKKIPRTAQDVEFLIKEHPSVKSNIEKLPIKLIFIKSDLNSLGENFAFVESLAKYFPNNFTIIEKSTLGKNNHFADTIKGTIKSYALKNKNFINALHKNNKEYFDFLRLSLNNNPPQKNWSKSKWALALIPITVLVSFIAYKARADKHVKSDNEN